VAKPFVQADAAFATLFSIHTANNLATKDTATKFLRGITGSPSMAQKVAPTFLRITKSLPARYGLAAAMLGSGAIAIYERVPAGVVTPTTKPSDANMVYVLRGEIDSNGNFQEKTAGKKP